MPIQSTKPGIVSLTPEVIKATWELFKKDFPKILRAVTCMLTDMKKCDGIYGVPKGGLPLAVKLANALDLPLLMHPTKQCICIDDIYDLGQTLNPLWEKYCKNGKSKIVVWYINKDKEHECLEKDIYWVRSKEAEQWVLFEMWE